MSSKKVKRIFRISVCSNVVQSGAGPYTYTCTTTAPHYLAVGDVFDITFTNPPQRIYSVSAISGTTESTVVFSLSDTISINVNAIIVTYFYSTSMTGAQDSFTLPLAEGARGIIQSFVSGNGGATYVLEVSLNGTNWNTLATIVHASSDGDTTFTSVIDPWSYYRVNITSVGTATKLYVLGAS